MNKLDNNALTFYFFSDMVRLMLALAQCGSLSQLKLVSIYDGSVQIRLCSIETSNSNKCNNSSTRGVCHALCREKDHTKKVMDET